MKKLLIATFLISLSGALLAAQNVGGLYQNTLNKNNKLLSKKQTMLGQQEDAKRLYALVLPEVALVGAYVGANPKITSKLKSGSTSIRGSDTYNLRLDIYGVVAKQTLFDLSKFIQVSEVPMLEKLSKLNYRIQKQAILYSFVKAYFDTLLAKEAYQAEDQRLNVMHAGIVLARKFYGVKQISYEQLQDELAKYEMARADQLKAKVQYQDAKLKLNTITRAKIGKLARLKSNVKLTKVLPIKTLSFWQKTSRKNNLQLQALMDEIQVAHKTYESGMASVLPKINAYAGYAYVHSNNMLKLLGVNQLNLNTKTNDESNARGPFVAVTATMPLFAGGSIYHNTKKALHNFEAAQENYDNLSYSLNALMTSLYIQVKAQRAVIEANKLSLNASYLSLKTAKKRFIMGEILFVDLLKEQALYTKAKVKYAQARYDYIQQWIKLNQQAGNFTSATIARVNRLLV
jgi:outer membrane protein